MEAPLISASALQMILVPQRAVNGGLDFKFESDSYNIRLHGMLTSQDYTDSVTVLNDTMKPARSKKVDAVLLATGPLMVPLVVWGVRHNMQAKKRKKLMKQGIERFNADHPSLLMRWNRKPESSLTIERRHVGQSSTAPTLPVQSSQNIVSLAEAQIVLRDQPSETPVATAYAYEGASGLV